MQMHGLERIVCAHPLFAGMGEEFCELAGGCARNVRFEAGQYLFREGDPANEFYLIRHEGWDSNWSPRGARRCAF
jgi:CRP/FNR family transcriptional regulator, cyclic AMP receptor protein